MGPRPKTIPAVGFVIPCVSANTINDYPLVPKAVTLQWGHQVNQNTGYTGTQEVQKDP